MSLACYLPLEFEFRDKLCWKWSDGGDLPCVFHHREEAFHEILR